MGFEKRTSSAKTTRLAADLNDFFSIRFLLLAVCQANQLYTYPSASTAAIDASAGPVVFKWDTSCDVADTIDLTLYAPALSNHTVIKVRPRTPLLSVVK
jgi:hypothetical protein